MYLVTTYRHGRGHGHGRLLDLHVLYIFITFSKVARVGRYM